MDKDILKLIGLLAGVFGMRALGDYIAPTPNGYLDIIPIIGLIALLVIGLRIAFNWQEAHQ